MDMEDHTETVVRTSFEQRDQHTENRAIGLTDTETCRQRDRR